MGGVGFYPTPLFPFYKSAIAVEHPSIVNIIFLKKTCNEDE